MKTIHTIEAPKELLALLEYQRSDDYAKDQERFDRAEPGPRPAYYGYPKVCGQLSIVAPEGLHKPIPERKNVRLLNDPHFEFVCNLDDYILAIEERAGFAGLLMSRAPKKGKPPFRKPAPSLEDLEEEEEEPQSEEERY